MIPAQKTKKLLFWLGLSLPMAALIAMTWLVHQTGGQFNNSFNWLLHTYKVMDLFEQTQAHIVDAEANERGYLLTGRADYLEPYQAAMQSVHDDLADLKTVTHGDPAQQANLLLLEKFVTDELVFDPATVFAGGQTANSSVVTLTERGKKKLEDARRILFQAREEQQRILTLHQQQAESDVVAGQVMSLVLIAAVALALVFVLVILLRLEKLQQFVTVCAWTGQVKFQGEWMRLDDYLKRQFGLSVSHSLSHDAADKMRREIEELNRPGAKNPPPDPRA